MDRNLIMHCYYDVSTSLKENKPLVEVTEKLQALADKYKMSLLDLTEIALEAGYYKSQIPEEDLKKYRDTIKKIRKPLLAVRREQLKGKRIINPQVEDLKTTREKMYLYKYFDALLKAYNLEMPIEISLIIISEKLGLNIDDIKKYSKIYLEKYALGSEKNNYNQKLKRQARLINNPTKAFVNNSLAYQVIQMASREKGSKLGAKIAFILSDTTNYDLNAIKNIIFKEYADKLNGVNDEEYRQYLFTKEEEIMSVLNYVIEEKSKRNQPDSKSSKEPRISKEKLENLKRFLSANMTLKDFGNTDAFSKGNRGISGVRKYLESACGVDEALKEKLRIHIHTVEEYELSYLNTILELLLDFRKNGVINGTSKREFDILDYYCLTNYPLTDLRTALINNHLIADSDLTYLSSLASKDDLHKYAYNKVSLDSFLNDVTGYLIDGKMRYLTKEEKEGIYEFFECYNIPATSYSIRTAVDRYLKGTLFLPSKSLDKQLARIKKD